MKDPHSRQYNGFRVSSGEGLQDGSVTDWSVTTDNHQGIAFLKDGRHVQRCKTTSQELCGYGLKDPQSPAKTIEAENGNIHLKALNGEIILEAANIRIIGLGGNGGEVTIQAGKIIQQNAPTYGVNATNATIAASGTFLGTGTAVSIYGGASCEATDGPSLDSSSLMGKILHIVDQIKKFFTSICNDSEGGGLDATAGANDATGATPGNVA